MSPSCAVPGSDTSVVLMGHGGGGRLTHDLLEKLVIPALRNPSLEARHDGALVAITGSRIAMSTDTYVVWPLFFPGGDIGRLAVHGTINDLSMCGARPVALSVAFIVEEGLPMETLSRVVRSIADAAAAEGVPVVTGDTKVVDRGKGDGLFVNTSGVGVLEHDLVICPAGVRPGDAIVLSGDIGRHGIAILAQREGISLGSAIESDSAPLWRPVRDLLEAGLEIHCLRDLTRGGLGTALVEIARAAPACGIAVDEASIPVDEAVRGACEILGLDPLFVANEGRFIAFLPEDQARSALEILRRHPCGRGAARIGGVGARLPGRVVMTTSIGTERPVEMLSGEQLPRIC